MDALSRGQANFLAVFVPGSYTSAEILAMESTHISAAFTCISVVNLWLDLGDHLFIRVLCKCIERVQLRLNDPVGLWGQKRKGKLSSCYTKHCVRPGLAESLPRGSNFSFHSSQLQPFTQITSRCHNTSQKYTLWSGILQFKRGVRRNTGELEPALMFYTLTHEHSTENSKPVQHKVFHSL